MTLPALPSSPAQERPAAAARAGGGATSPGAAGNPCVLLPALAPNVITVGATSPASEGVGGFSAMSEERERELMRHVHTIRSTAEMDGFRAQLSVQGETPTAGLYQALMKQSERLK